MKSKTYLISFGVLLIVEICIALFIHDRFIRPYVGDVLVTALLCCFVRCVFPNRPKMSALYVFLFGVAVEMLQILHLSDMLPAGNDILGFVLGSTFDPKDILCYFIGCVLFFAAEELFDSEHNG